MKFLSLLACLIMLCSFNFVRANDAPSPITELCSGQFEGSATGSIANGKSMRMNLFCIDTTRMAASVYVDGVPNLSLTFSAISDGILILSQFPLGSDDRKTISSYTSLTYVKLNVDDLKQGKVSGYLMNGNLIFPLKISGAINQHFPSVQSLQSGAISHSQFIGVYTMRIPQGASGKMDEASLWVDINDNVPFFNMKIKIPIGHGADRSRPDAVLSGGTAIHFIDGSKWDGKGGFDAITSFGDTMTTGVPLWQLRGRVVASGTLEIYVIDPVNGIRGPIIASKVGDPWLFLNKGSNHSKDAARLSN